MPRDPLTAEQQSMVEEYARQWPDPLPVFAACWPAQMAAARASKIDDDDIRSACWAAVIRAAQKYDPEHAKGSSFASYAHHWMRGFVGHLVTGRRTGKRSGTTISGDATCRASKKGADGGSLWEVLGLADETDPAGDPEEFDRLATLRAKLAEALNRLDPRRRQIIELRYGLVDGIERTLEEVAEVFGVTRERIHQMESQSFERLRIPLLLSCGELAGGFARGPEAAESGRRELVG